MRHLRATSPHTLVETSGFNSLFEMLSLRWWTRGDDLEAGFNSLFEMLKFLNRFPRTKVENCFNSLFEMRICQDKHIPIEAEPEFQFSV